MEFPRGGGPGSYRGSRGSDRNRGEGRSNRGPVTKRSQYRVLVSGLPPSGSWQDLKDHMREAGDVCFADTYKDGTGVVEFLRLDDMKYAIKKLDDSRFRSHEVCVTHFTEATSCPKYIFNECMNTFRVFRVQISRVKWLMSEYAKMLEMIDEMVVTGNFHLFHNRYSSRHTLTQILCLSLQPITFTIIVFTTSTSWHTNLFASSSQLFQISFRLQVKLLNIFLFVCFFFLILFILY